MDVTKENHRRWSNPDPYASSPRIPIGPIYDLKMPPFVSAADHQSIRKAALLEGMLIERARVVKWLRDQSAGSTHEWAKSAGAYADIIEHYEHECGEYNLPPAK